MRHKTTHSCLPLLLLFVSLFLPVPGMAQRRVALVIGNAAYQEGPLRNSVNDAQDMAQALRTLRFEVIEVTNADKKQMLDAINTFGGRIVQADVGLFYYAGHGVQYRGQNYLIPVRTAINSPADLEQETVDAGRILGRMEQSQAALSVVILDACRNNPFRSLLAFRSYEERGLAALAPPVRGALIAYATQPNNVASDGTGRNGIYTHHLLRYLTQPGLSLPELFNAVGLAVSQATQGKQVPWTNSSPLPRFCFAGCELSSHTLPPSQSPPPPIEMRTGRYRDNGNGTITDTQANLMWAARDNGSDINWREAQRYATNYTIGGYRNWRLPSISELQALVDINLSPSDTACKLPDGIYAVHRVPAPIVLSCPFLWSSETQGVLAGRVVMSNGSLNWLNQGNRPLYRVLPVRFRE